jgi:hypothetical protein
MMKITVVRSTDIDGLYVNGNKVKQSYSIDLDDIYFSANREKFILEMKYADPDAIRLAGYVFPSDLKDLVELDN